ncbi:unnamed protein product [Meloidogyne enterolobii]|uniref:Uncharacterized protein n=5 Tax=Meloidogyne TaxID=189290 RepID=A0A6V7WSV2_MELEN|nr:unnamed protein product [Meloidogyne enterolobii]CAD2190002.1 unnamed protein product [Meloidogyne enterolobii]
MSELNPHKLSTGSHKLSVGSRKDSGRKQSMVERAEAAGIDKNTIILTVNLMILIVLVGILYVIATSAMNVSGGQGSRHHATEQ